MKRRIASAALALCLVLALLPVHVQAASSGSCGENLTWTLNSDGVLTIKGTGPMKDYYYGLGEKPPAVSSLSTPWGNQSLCPSIKTIKIEDGVTCIGNYAFYYCENLTSVTIPGSVTGIGDRSFSYCKSLAEVIIPNSVTSIGEAAFSSSGLTEIEIPESITVISGRTFNSCRNLVSVSIPDSVTGINYGAFASCSSLTSITIPENVTTIGAQAFEYCSKLTEVYLPRSVDSIGEYAFYMVRGLKIKYGSSEENWDRIYKEREAVPATATIEYTEDEPYTPYTITFDANGGEITSDYNSMKTTINGRLETGSRWPSAQMTGCYALEGWYRTADGSGERIDWDTKFTQDTTIYAKWYEHHEAVVNTSAPAKCTEDGWKDRKICQHCKKILEEGTSIPANGHKEEPIPDVPPTCGAFGSTGGKKCSVCGEITVPPDSVPSTNQHTRGEILEERIMFPPSCTVDGTKKVTYECSNCGQVFQKEEPIPSKGHTEVEIAAVDATCTAPGWTAGVECSVCRAVLKEPERVEMAPHRWGPEQEEVTKPATCTEGGLKTYKKICAVCKNEESRPETFGPNGHTVVVLPEVPATCTKDGKTAGEECSVCGVVLKAQEDIPPLEHAWTISGGTETITKKPTCTEAGEKTITGGSTCSRCNAETTDEQTVEIPPLTHQWGEAAEEVIKPPTCKEKGIKTITRLCTRDGCQEKDEKTEELDLLAHTWGEWKTVQEPTATEAGMKERDCAVCGDKETEEIAATGTTPGGEDNKPEEKPGGEDSKPEEKPGDEDNKPEEKPGGEDNKPEEKPGDEDNKPEEKPGDEDNKPVTPPGPVRYRIYTPGSVSGGSYDVSHSSAVQGARITVEVSPRRNYELEWLAVTNLTTGQELHLTQRGSDEYTFVMPASSVELDISYDGSRYIVYEEPQLKTGPNAWYYRDRHIYHVENGLVPDGTHITRDMLISVLYNMTSPAVISRSIGCETNDSQVWATDNGIVPDIYASGLWGFDKILSREQAAMLIFRYAGYRGCGTAQRQTITRYSDYSRLRPDARAAMSWAVATGLMPGASASTLAPRDSITCGQMGELLFKFEATILR
ncbi:MAG: leucine-rich repeat protein [Lawsonibacter sp.]|nr:leucine-rich repeat protein [Lawsonibacter sp.]